MNPVRRALDHVEVPEEHEARERAWELVQAAWAEREPAPRRPSLRPLLVAAAALALVGAALSPPGRAVIEEVREAVGVEQAEPQLFSLPSGGSVLVTSTRGAFVVAADGSRRLLGRYREASWSPAGRFVVAARANELVALEPDGALRWSLPRRDVRLPRWGGSETDTRLAYLSGSRLRVVAGDGTGDRELGSALRVAPAWRPGGPEHVLAYVRADGRVAVRDADSGRVLTSTARAARAQQLLWAGDRLLVVRRDGFALVDARGRTETGRTLTGRLGRAALAPGGTRFAVVRRLGDRSEVLVLDAARPAAAPQRVFSGAGAFSDLAWSPDGRWLLVAWRDADQWVFLRSAGVRRVEAVSRIAGQFRADVFPTLDGWCCPAQPAPSNTVSQGGNAAGASASEREARAAPGASDTVLQGLGRPAIVWRRSSSPGLPWEGRLVDGVQLPAEGERFLTFDPILRRPPNRGWRRWGSDRLVRTLLRVVDEYAAAHPEAPRLLIGDLSRRHGGAFDARFGFPGHMSHQNGLDVDLYYPRRDGRERPPDGPRQIDLALAQDLVDRFVAAGAQHVFVGPATGLEGPAGVVQELRHHDTHLHVRIPARG